MKLSELSIDRAADVLCELTPYVHNIVTDKDIADSIGKVEDIEELNTYEIFMLFMDRLCVFVPLLLKTHRSDICSILSLLDEKTEEEIAAQPLTATLAQLHDVLHDEGLRSFFKSFIRRGESGQSAPSSAVPG